jgi:hypothetical protein
VGSLALVGAALVAAAAVAGCGVDVRPPSGLSDAWRMATSSTPAVVTTTAPDASAPARPQSRPATAAVVTYVPATHTPGGLRARLRDATKAGFIVGPLRQSGDAVSMSQSFRFQGKRRTVRFSVPRSDFAWSEGRSLEISVYPGESRTEQLKRFWTTVTLESHQRALYDSLAESFRSIRRSARLTSDEYAELIAAYVQQMPYDTQEAESAASNRYPASTAMRGTGVCGDKSILLAGLLAHEGYRVSLLEFEDETHMSVGLGTRGSGYRGTHLAFVETTGPGLVGEVGKAYGTNGTIVLKSSPLVITVASSGIDYRAGDQVAFILDRRRAYDRTYASLRERIETARAKLDRYDRASVDRYNALIGRLNRAAATINMTIDHQDDREALYAYLKARGAP